MAFLAKEIADASTLKFPCRYFTSDDSVNSDNDSFNTFLKMHVKMPTELSPS